MARVKNKMMRLNYKSSNLCVIMPKSLFHATWPEKEDHLCTRYGYCMPCYTPVISHFGVSRMRALTVSISRMSDILSPLLNNASPGVFFLLVSMALLSTWLAITAFFLSSGVFEAYARQQRERSTWYHNIHISSTIIPQSRPRCIFLSFSIAKKYDRSIVQDEVFIVRNNSSSIAVAT